MPDYTTTLTVTKSPAETYAAINNVKAWWHENMQGKSKNVGDEFSVQFKDIHFSKHKLIELVPDKKIVWLVTDAALTNFKDQKEWIGTTNTFDIQERDGKTQIVFTHQGLNPEIECYESCSGGWNHFLHLSLYPFIETGVGQPGLD